MIGRQRKRKRKAGTTGPRLVEWRYDDGSRVRLDVIRDPQPDEAGLTRFWAVLPPGQPPLEIGRGSLYVDALPGRSSITLMVCDPGESPT